ncbi:hypothetical protein XaC1_116 [Xanthomonas phage XaC1]|nr:hypothetical protein XaC1_116 [Xanthomonas phage XaC1]
MCEFKLLFEVFEFMNEIKSTDELEELCKVTFDEAGDGYKILRLPNSYNIYKGNVFKFRVYMNRSNGSFDTGTHRPRSYHVEDNKFIIRHKYKKQSTELDLPISKDEFFNLSISNDYKFTYEELVKAGEILSTINYQILCFVD